MPEPYSLPGFSELLQSVQNDLSSTGRPLPPHPWSEAHNHFQPLIIPWHHDNNDTHHDNDQSTIPTHPNPSHQSSFTSRYASSTPPPPLPPSLIHFDEKYVLSRLCTTPGYQFACCPKCKHEFKVPIASPDYQWSQHLISAKCKTGQTRLQAKQVRDEAEAERRAQFPRSTSRRPHIRAVSGPASSSEASINPRHALRTLNTSGAPPSAPASLDIACPGAILPWIAERPHQTFPFHLLEEHPSLYGFRLASFVQVPATDEGTIRVRSLRCRAIFSSADGATSCSECLAVVESPGARTLHEHAIAPWRPHMRHDKMTRAQFQEAFEHRGAQLSSIRVQRHRAEQRAVAAEAREQSHQRFVAAIATRNVPRIQRLVQVALAQGCSMAAVIERIEAAVANVYHVRSYTDTEIDLARLMWHLAGDQGVYILHKALGLPSVTTIRANSVRPTIYPCVSTPTLDEILRNLSNVFPRTPAPSSKRSGYVLMFDGLAIVSRVRRSLNMMVGPCRECSGSMNLSMSALANIVGLATGMRGEQPLCHCGTEATVGAAAALSKRDYHGVPFFVSASCKRETASEFKSIIALNLDAWNLACADIYGDIWVIGCDGASVFRGACFMLLMDRQLSPELNETLSPLRGLNLMCGKDDVVHCPDTKHVLKRFGTLLRSPEGMLVNGTLINRTILAKFLLRLPNETAETVKKMLDPKDHQNVPNAIRLLESISALRDLDPESAPYGTERITLVALKLLGAIWDSILQAFLDEDYSLSDQLASLSTFAHLIYALYISHGSAFMSNQLYSDAQALVKAAHICVARQKRLDPDEVFFLYQLGSDRLEELFAEVRTQCHDRNCDLLQACDRLTTGVDMRRTLNKNQAWDRGQWRRAFRKKGGPDHVNPTMYNGDLVAGHVDFFLSWDHGRVRTQALLDEAGLDFDILRSLERHGGDFMRPFNESYPGSSTEKDRSVIEDDTEATGGLEVEAADASATPCAATSSAADHLMPSDELDPEGYELRSILSDGIAQLQREHSQDGEPDSSPSPGSSSHPDSDPNLPGPPLSPAPDSDWILVPRDDGTDPVPVHKETLLRLWFNDGIDSSLSFDRVRRVRGYTKYGCAPTSLALSENTTVTSLARSLLGAPPDSMSVLPPQPDDTSCTLSVDDVALIPVRCDETIAIAFIRVSGIECAGRKVSDVFIDDLGNAHSKIFVSGEVFEMQPEASCPRSEAENGAQTRRWLWTGRYIRFNAASGKATDAELGTKSSYVVRTPGHLVVPIEERMEAASLLPPEHRTALERSRSSLTYSVSEDCLIRLIQTVYSPDITSPATLVSSLPKHGAAEGFPYHIGGQESRFVLTGVEEAIAQKRGDEAEKLACYQCERPVKRKDLRGHVGEHILRALVGQTESDLRVPITVTDNLCGFCGRPGCAVGLDGSRVSSTCPRFWAFYTGWARRSSKTTPSTNMPIECTLCRPLIPRSKKRPAYWKYNIFEHIKLAHPAYWDPSEACPRGIPKDFKESIDVTALEIDAIAPSRSRSYPTHLPESSVPSKRSADSDNDLDPNALESTHPPKRTRQRIF